MQALRRAVVALIVAVGAMVVVRLRGTGGTPPRRGGWRQLDPDELAPTSGAGPTDG
ncbi:MAG TPA: hypothetical protein VFP61_00760 [Acidimicrobiales bacterium]|nr:hypothetical protein [Acidimicrobiales bacterium]